jgi:hypothetical protein
MTNPDPYARPRCGVRPSRCVRPSISLCRLRSRGSSPSNVRRAVRHAPHSTPGWTWCWTMPCCDMGDPASARRVASSSVPDICLVSYYTPSAAAHLDSCMPQRISGGPAGQSTSRSTHDRCTSAYPADRTDWSLTEGHDHSHRAPFSHRAYRPLKRDAASLALQRRQTGMRARALRPGQSATDRDTGLPLGDGEAHSRIHVSTHERLAAHHGLHQPPQGLGMVPHSPDTPD